MSDINAATVATYSALADAFIRNNPYQHDQLQQLALSALQQNDMLRAIELMHYAALCAPTIPSYRRNVGELLRRIGKLDAAIANHTLAVELAPQVAENHFHLGLALFDKQDYAAAVKHYRIAISLDPGYGLAWNNLGAALEISGDKTAAKQAYTQAIHLNPAHAEAQNNLGAICSEEGKLDEARTHFSAAIAVNPEFVEAHYNLSSLKTYQQDDPSLAILLSLNTNSLSVSARIRYYFALGKALHDTQQYARAFQAYDEGNRLQYAQEPWDDRRLNALTQQIKTVFKQPLHKAHSTNDSRVPIFIVGMPRSGTTLIEQTLSSHADIHGAGEISILDDVIHSVKGASLHAPFTDWVAKLTDEECIALGNQYLERTWQLAPHKKFIIDKMPGNSFYIGMIYRMLPEAKIIHALRDPMDSCFSCFTKLFNHSMPFAYNQISLGKYYLYYAQVMQHWHAVLPQGTILDLHYENMVADHEQQTRRLLDYIGLPWDDNCRSFYKNSRPVKTASVAQVRKPIYHTSVKRWMHFAKELQPLARTLAGDLSI